MYTSQPRVQGNPWQLSPHGVLTGVPTPCYCSYMNTETTKTSHRLICDGTPLAKGAKMERPWHCTCGQTFSGFDSAVRKDFAAHKAATR